MTLSTGEKVAPPKYLAQYAKKLRLAQKALSRKQKGSNNRYKARLKLARVHQKVSNCRRDRLHKLTTRLIRENQTIVAETL